MIQKLLAPYYHGQIRLREPTSRIGGLSAESAMVEMRVIVMQCQSIVNALCFDKDDYSYLLIRNV
jgi:hypothetical protein